MVVIAGGRQWMLLLEFIRTSQGKLRGSIEDAAAAVLAMLRIGAVPARRCGPDGAVPLDGRYEHWNGLLYPAAWHVASIHEDGTVSFDVSEGIAALRRAQQHAIEVRHTIEVERSAALRCLQDALLRAGKHERPHWAGARKVSFKWMDENGVPTPDDVGQQAKLEDHVIQFLKREKAQNKLRSAPVPSTVREHVKQFIEDYRIEHLQRR
jgi:hypothetical protein